jgi:hypothetical protein
MLTHFTRLDRHSCAKGIAPTYTTVERGIVLMNERMNSKICPLDGLDKSIMCVCSCTCMCDLYFDVS